MRPLHDTIFKTLRNDNLNTGAAGLTLVLCLFYLYAGAWICLGCGGSVNGWIYPAAVVAAMLSATTVCGWRGASFMGTICAAAIIMLCTGLSALIDDYSYDGNTYHQEIIIYLLEGWNPLKQPIPAAECSAWSIHYAKGLELAAACVAASTGFIETGKTVNMLLILGTGLVTYRFVKYRFPMLSKFLRTVLTLVVVANVVGMAQVLTFYTDFATYYLVVLTIIFACDYLRSGSCYALLLMAVMTVLAAGVKFTVFFYQCFAVVAIVGWCLWRRDLRQGVAISLAAFGGAFIGMLILGYHPYVINTLVGGNPFYPLIGSAQTDIMTSNTPEIFAEHNRFFNFFRSLLCVEFPKYDQRVGGFGPMMPLMLVLAFLNIAWASAENEKHDPKHILAKDVWNYIAWVSLLSCFCFEQSWWARYICQLWLVVVAGVFAAVLAAKEWDRSVLGNGSLKVKGTRKLLFSAMVLAAMALVSGSAALAGGIRQGRMCHTQRQQIYERVEGETLLLNAWPSTLRHLNEQDIRGIEADSTLINKNYEIINFYGSDLKAKTPKVLIKKES